MRKVIFFILLFLLISQAYEEFYIKKDIDCLCTIEVKRNNTNDLPRFRLVDGCLCYILHKNIEKSYIYFYF